jgi:uncharacterized protein YegJ (DUF2314 family)
MKSLIPILCSFFVLAACTKSTPPKNKPDTLMEEFDEATMDAAITKARGSVEEFITALAAQSAESYSVKAPIHEGEKTEHFWIVDVTYKDGTFSGTIGNDPGIVSTVKFGQKWELKKEEISDWMYTKDDRIYGGYTIDPLLDSMPTDEADALRKQLVR